MRDSWRSTRVWLRRERLTNIALTLLRSVASWPASRTASRCTSSKARATWPISSSEATPIGAMSSAAASPLSRMLCTVSGRRWPAMDRASVRSVRSGLTSDRAMIAVMTRTRMSSSTLSPPAISAPCCSDSWRTRLCVIRVSAIRFSTARIRSMVSEEASNQVVWSPAPVLETSMRTSGAPSTASTRARARMDSARSFFWLLTVSS
ncbi:hypothetical protein Aros01_09451 [Streptosporangium roseum]